MVKRLFVDADAFVALKNAADLNHGLALRISKEAVARNIPLVTSDPALGEAITVISQNVSHKDAVDFAEEIFDSEIEIVEVNQKYRNRGVEIFKKQKSKNMRFTDCINMAILEEENSKEIFSFDLHYKKNKIARVGLETQIENL